MEHDFVAEILSVYNGQHCLHHDLYLKNIFILLNKSYACMCVWQFDWTHKGHLKMTLYNISLDLYVSDTDLSEKTKQLKV